MDRKVKVSFPGGKRVDAQIGGHTIQTDKTVAHGGTDSAPDPFNLFLASLATCSGYYALEFCQTREIDTDGLAIELESDWDKDKKLAAKIVIKLHLPINFPEKYREAIIRAVELCTVKRHLINPPAISLEIN